MKIRTQVKSGGRTMNHNQACGLRVRSHVKSGGKQLNHSQSLV